jgi:hypothetical protein
MMSEDKFDPFAGPVESETRRSDFVGGVPIRLIDGQEWHFAEPRMRFVPSGGDQGFQVILSLDDDGTFNDLYERFNVLVLMPRDEFAPHAMERAAIEVKMASMMLLRNYSLSPRELTRVLQFSHDAENDPDAARVRMEIVRALLGEAPKPSAGGGEPSATPPAC